MDSYSFLHPGPNLSTLRHCEDMRDMYDSRINDTQVVEWYKYTCDGILVSAIGLVGIIGNLCAVLVLSRPKLRDCFHQLLIALAFFDTLYICCGGINYTFRAFDQNVPLANKNAYKITYPHLILPFLNIGMCGTIFMTVAISIERFLGICHPLVYPPHTRKSWFYILPVLLISVLVNIPKFLEAELYWDDDINAISFLLDEAANENVTVGHIPKYIPNYRPTQLRMNETYIEIYLMYFRMFCIAIIPLMLIILLNARILYDIGTSKIQRFESKRRWRREMNLFFILLCIVITFICCHTPRIITDIWELSHNNDRRACQTVKKVYPHLSFISPNWVQCLSHVSHAMGVLNSSVNFIIYSFVGHTFRHQFFLLLRCDRRRSENTHTSYMDGDGSRKYNSTVQYNTSQYNNVQNSTSQYNTVQQDIKQYNKDSSPPSLSDIEEKQKMLEIV